MSAGGRAGGAAAEARVLSGRGGRLAEIVGAVARQALADRGVPSVALIDEGGPEAELAAEWLARALPAGALLRITEPHPGVESLLQSDAGGGGGARVRLEALRLRARLVEAALVANPINRTALLLSGGPPPDPLLPLGDLYASEVEELAGGWTAPEAVQELAERAGGIARLDAALRARLDARDPRGLATLPDGAGAAVMVALGRGRAARRTPWVVPKIGYRTLGVDLYE